MAVHRSNAGSGKSTGGTSNGGSGSSGSSFREVSAARLHQKAGPSNAFGGYAKVKNADGTFRMKESGK